MTTISEWIVCLWLLPVTLFVILPFILLVIWNVSRIVSFVFDLFRFGRVETWRTEAART